jgi:hypothetical protein
MLLNTVSEKLISTNDDENTTLNLVHDSLEARMALLKTIVVSCPFIPQLFDKDNFRL